MSTTLTVIVTLCLSSLVVLGWLQLSVVLPRLAELSSRRQGPSPEEEEAWSDRALEAELADKEAELAHRLARMRERAA